MKKIAIVTINDNNNYGNRLQNYAVQETIKKIGKFNVITIKNLPRFNNKGTLLHMIKKIIAQMYSNIKKYISNNRKRSKCFKNFNKNIKFSYNYKTIYSNMNNKFDYFIVGSDQVWKPTYGRMSQMDLLSFADPGKRISFSASFGVDKLKENEKRRAKKELEKFKAISVREEAGKKIIENLKINKNVEVLVDPTMLLSDKEWNTVIKKVDGVEKKKYILNYFLGNLSETRKKEIDKIAQKYDCKVINLLDKNDEFYKTGPSEFLYLEKEAFLVCTDSFHSSVFSIIFDTPFIVFDREDNNVNMNSRIDTLLRKFNLEDRRFNGKITDKLLKCDYTDAKKILKIEKEKSNAFLKKALDIDRKDTI